MFEQVDLMQRIEKEDYKEQIKDLQTKMFFLQTDAYKAKIPLIIVLEGWASSGKGAISELLIEKLDPRGYEVYQTQAATLEEQYHPYFWRFWIKTPAQGEIKIFNQSWYYRVLYERMEEKIKKEILQNTFREINQFERQLVDSGTLILKFWLHISQKEQKQRLKKASRDKYQKWRVSKQDRREHKKYHKYAEIIEEMLQRTSTHSSPWKLISCEDVNAGKVAVMGHIAEQLTNKIKDCGAYLTKIPDSL